MNQEELQAEMKRQVRFIADVLTANYTVHFKIDASFGGGHAAANVMPDEAYFSAKIKLNPFYSQTHETMFEYLTHEHIHILMGPVRAAYHAMREALNEREAKITDEVFRVGDEQTVVMLTRVIYPRLWVEYTASNKKVSAESKSKSKGKSKSKSKSN